MVADLAGPAYKFELSSAVPSIGMVNIFGSLLFFFLLNLVDCWKPHFD